jgi:hypothetical protein
MALPVYEIESRASITRELDKTHETITKLFAVGRDSRRHERGFGPGGSTRNGEALHHLREARAHLERAEHNKGGWRIRAIENVDRAIRETENGMAVAR